MISETELNFFSAPGKIRLKPLLKKVSKTDRNKIVNIYIII